MAFLKVLSEERQERTEKAALFQGVDIDGILLIGETDKGCAAELKKLYEIPVVCVGSYDISEEADSIVPDCYGGMEQVTELLLEAGHKELVFVGSPEEGTNAADCYLGFCKAMEKRGLEANIVRLPQPDRTEKNRLRQRRTSPGFSRMPSDVIQPQVPELVRMRSCVIRLQVPEFVRMPSAAGQMQGGLRRPSFDRNSNKEIPMMTEISGYGKIGITVRSLTVRKLQYAGPWK